MFPETCFVKMAFFLLCGEEKVRYYRAPAMYQVVIIVNCQRVGRGGMGLESTVGINLRQSGIEWDEWGGGRGGTKVN
jgi:hypothetical protein